ncbi:MAG TPA: hypothetical protein VFN24_06020 [Microbacterium sp.]|nr:hypothetical protein [Microbacterium sp.]
MAATVLRLRYRVLGNTLARNPWQLVGFCFGMLGALWVLGLVAVGVVAANIALELETIRMIAALGGSLLLLGWVLGPVLLAGFNATVDAPRLAPFPLSLRQVMVALAATGITGIPGITSALAVLVTIGLWVRWPIAAVAAVPSALLALLTCVVASRLVATLSSGTGRRWRELVGTVLLVVVILTGPIISGVSALLDRAADLGAQLTQVTGILAWTPIGAAWAVPGDVAAGEWLIAAARFAIAVATPAVLWLVWARALRESISSPPHRAARAVGAGRIGLFAIMPTGGTGATWARSLTAWLRDPRYLRQLLVIPILPILLLFGGGVEGPMFTASALFVALVLALVGYTDVSYDGTAFGTVLAAGIRGRADRLGRALAAACVLIPLIVILAVVVAVLSGAPERLPALLGGCLGLLLAGFGVTAVSSALLATPVAAPGDSPFKSVPGQTFVSGLLVFVVLIACVVAASPPLALAVISLLTGSVLLGGVSLAVAIGYGLAVAAVGVIVGGRVFDRRGPELLMTIKNFATS